MNRLIVTLLYKTKASHLSSSSKISDPDSGARNTNTSPSTLLTHATSNSHISTSQKTILSSNCYISSDSLTCFASIISSILQLEDPSSLAITYRYLDDLKQPSAVEIVLSLGSTLEFPSISNLRENSLISQFTTDWNIDITFQRESVFRRYPRLVCFDMDSTLIEEEIIDIIAASIKVEAEVSEITKRAMNGELDFCDSLRARCKLLVGVNEDIFFKMRDVVTPNKGLKGLLKALKQMGVRTAVFSGGFLPFVSWFAKEFGIDYAYANSLAVTDGLLTGELEGSIVDAERKKELLYEIAAKEGIGLDQVVAIGDGANDLLMLNAAGLGVAWNAKPIVQMHAQARLNRDSLLDLLYFFGLTSEEIKSFIS